MRPTTLPRPISRYALILLQAALMATSSACRDERDQTTDFQKILSSDPSDDSLRSAAHCSDCAVLNRAPVSLPLTHKTFTEAKLWSETQRLDYGIALDEDGNTVDPAELLAAEGAARIARQGKLRDDVYSLSLTSSAQTVPVWIWADLRDNDHFTPRREELLADANLRAAHRSQRSAKLQAVSSKVTTWLDARGFKTFERGTNSPAISADVPSSALAELGRLDGVAVVERRTPGRPTSTAWFGDTKVNSAQTIVSSAAGQSFCNSEFNTPDDVTYISASPSQFFSYPGTQSTHIRWTTELIGATAGNRVAPNATPYIVDWDTFPVTDAWSWCYSTLGVENLNMSWRFDDYTPGGLSVTDMAQDYYVYQWPYPSITSTAGNCNDDCGTNCFNQTGHRTVSSRSYNILVVGGANDHGTSSPSDDTMAVFSPYDNPTTTHNDFELPNLVAPALGIDSVSVTNWCGTSGAAPQVLGAALLLKARSSDFSGFPEMTRATILASSTRGLDTSGRTVNLVSGGGAQKQGAGLLNTYNAVVLADPANRVGPNTTAKPTGRDVQFYTFSTDFPGGIANNVYNISITKTGRLRVVIAWDASASGCGANGTNCLGDVPDADIDLWVYQKSGSSWIFRCASNTYDGTWELCDSSVTAGQTYKAELHLRTANSTATYLGIAWRNYNPSTDE